MRIQEISMTILRQMPHLNKWRRDFLSHLFPLVFALRGRLNFKNMSRYSPYNESSFHRHFSQSFDFSAFNSYCLDQIKAPHQHWIAAADCSFINKSGKRTYGLDKFWSGHYNREKLGLEISAVGLIEVNTKQAYMLQVKQTPAGLGKVQGQSRVDFYMEQLQQVLPQLYHHGVSHVALDGFYAKTKVFQAFDQWKGMNIIGKLRHDANLRYLYDETERGPALTRRRYDGKVRFDGSTNGWRRWQQQGYTDSGAIIYSRVLNAKAFKRDLKVVACLDQLQNKYVLLFSTDLTLSAAQIIQYYTARFQIEFLFRDAKQFTGLEHSQTRQKEKLDFHFNMSLSAINLARLDMSQGNTVQNLNDYQRLAYNQKIINLFIANSALDPEMHIYKIAQRKSSRWGLMRA